MGVHTIGNLMKKMSSSANLSKPYTAHCIRSTVVTNLFNKGLSTQDIQCVTGHKNENSVKKYIRRVGDDKKQKFSLALNSSFMTEEATHSSSNALTSATIHKELQSNDGHTTESLTVHGTPSKKMKILADGQTNIVSITFE